MQLKKELIGRKEIMANDMQTLVLKNTNTQLSSMLEKEAQALPKGFNTLRFKQNAMTVLSSLDLSKMRGQEFNLARCIIKGAYLGLDFSNKECYVITYGGKPEFMTDYKGEEKLVYNYSVRPVKNIYSQVVKEGEKFEIITNGTEKTIIHNQGISDKPIIGAYTVVTYEDGTINTEIMTKKEIEVVRDKFSKQSRGKAWGDSFGEMARKTVLRRLCKHIQLNFDTIEQQQAWNSTSDVNFENKPTEVTKSQVEKDLEADGTIQDVSFEEV